MRGQIDKRYLTVSKYLAYGYAWVYTLGLLIGFGYLVLRGDGGAALRGERAFHPVFFGLDLVLAVLFLVVLLRFREVLEKKFEVRTLDVIIPMVGIANLFLVVMGNLPGRVSSLIALLPFAAATLVYGIRLGFTSHDLLGIRSFYSFTMIACGVAGFSLILAPLMPIFWIMGGFALGSFFARAEQEELL